MNLHKDAHLVLLLVLVGAFAFGQVNANNLVNVNVSNVANQIAKNLSVNVSQIPVTVQVPVDVAAQVCGVDVNVLTQQAAQGNATCTARQTSSALNSVVQQQIQQKK